jgi:folate-dependent phosphoribosylglycinamide formyltransferase PurN
MVEKLEQDYGILKRMVDELADDLYHEVRSRYEGPDLSIHPALMPKYNRDMAVIHKAWNLIGKKL